MKILIVGLNYAPEHSGIAPYTSGLAEGLRSRGHTVRVITGVPHYPAWSNFTGFTGWRREEVLDDVMVTRRRHFIADGGRGLSRVSMELSFAAASATELWHQPDVVVCLSPALFAAAAVVARARLQRVPVVVWVQDLYGAGSSELGTHWAASSLLPRVERAVLRSADAVTVIHERFQTHATKQLGVPGDRVAVVRNWSHHAIPAVAESVANIRRRQNWEGRTVALHTGNMGAKQALENLVEAGRVAECRNSDVQFVLVGEGSQRRMLAQLSRGCKNVSILGPVADSAYGSLLAAADVLLVNERPGMRETSVPSKLTSYFQSGRPIIAAAECDGATAVEVISSGAGLVTAPADPEGLLKAVISLRSDPERCRTMGESGRAYAEKHLSAFAGVAAFERLLTQVATAASNARVTERSAPLAVAN
jgi:glycosyltransferase involved in cell wall biosynthesis